MLKQPRPQIRAGNINGGPILVRGRPLTDYVPLDEVARWLRKAK
ncbi:MAG: hypothetical protein ACE5JD_15845 [Candidatus Methylomirabilia bacterium]